MGGSYLRGGLIKNSPFNGGLIRKGGVSSNHYGIRDLRSRIKSLCSNAEIL